MKFAKFVGERVSEGRRPVFHGESNIDSRIIGDDDFIFDLILGGDAPPEQKPVVNRVIAAVKRLYGITDHG